MISSPSTISYTAHRGLETVVGWFVYLLFQGKVAIAVGMAPVSECLHDCMFLAVSPSGLAVRD